MLLKEDFKRGGGIYTDDDTYNIYIYVYIYFEDDSGLNVETMELSAGKTGPRANIGRDCVFSRPRNYGRRSGRRVEKHNNYLTVNSREGLFQLNGRVGPFNKFEEEEGRGGEGREEKCSPALS